MVSNGLAMTPERYTRLLNAGLKSLTISLDGLESKHNHFRGKPPTTFQEKYNVKKSRTRCRIEHVFGWVKGNHELFVRTIGKARAEAKILASFLTYNMFRMVALTRPKWA
ncbi:MAG: transposase [Fibrobacter sp.]|nr:transposase [Fibrobacter sp.]